MERKPRMEAPGLRRRAIKPVPGSRFSGANVAMVTAGRVASAAASSASIASAVVCVVLPETGDTGVDSVTADGVATGSGEISVDSVTTSGVALVCLLNTMPLSLHDRR